MNWLALSGWRTGNGDPPVPVQRLYLPGNTATKQDVADVLSSGLQVGIYEAPIWYTGGPILTAEIISLNANRLIRRVGTQEAPPLMLDLEGMDSAFYADLVTEYRKHQPRRPTSFTTEPWKGDGRLLPLATLEAAGLHWYVQTFDSAMNEVDPAGVILNACNAYPPSMVHTFYNGRNMPNDRRGSGCVLP